MTAGVYQILNKVNAKRFIGSSSDASVILKSVIEILEDEIKDSWLVNELSSNHKLFEDWRYYSKENFSLTIIEKTSRRDHQNRKRYWCRLLQPAYNRFYYLPFVAGVYQIFSLKDGYSYIGQSKDIHQRWMTHRGQLRVGCHYNKQLQASYNLHGESSFELRILEVYQPDLKPLVELEKQWIKKTDNLFNIVV